VVWEELRELSRSSHAGRAFCRGGSCRGDQGRKMEPAIMTLQRASCRPLGFCWIHNRSQRYLRSLMQLFCPCVPVKSANGKMRRLIIVLVAGYTKQLVHATALPMTLLLLPRRVVGAPDHNHMPPIVNRLLASSTITLFCISKGYP